MKINLRDENFHILADIYDDFYTKTFELVKKNDPLYANSDQDFDLFLKFLKDHDMDNYASFLSNFEKDKNLLIEFEKDIESYKNYFNPSDKSYLHLDIDIQLDEDGNPRNLGN